MNDLTKILCFFILFNVKVLMLPTLGNIHDSIALVDEDFTCYILEEYNFLCVVTGEAGRCVPGPG